MAIDWDALVLAPAMSVFGDAVLYQQALNGASFSIPDVVFDRAYTETKTDAETGALVQTRKPALGVRAAAFPAGIEPMQGDFVQIDGRAWTVMDPRSDGHGHFLLILAVPQAGSPW